MKRSLHIFLFILIAQQTNAQMLRLESPHHNLLAVIDTAKFSYSVYDQGKIYIQPSGLGMSFSNGGTICGDHIKILSMKRRTVDDQLKPFYGISSAIRAHYNELILNCGDYDVVFRAYNEGFAYRFITRFKDSVNVLGETAVYKLAGNFLAYMHPALSEADYKPAAISSLTSSSYTSTPLLLKAPDGMNILLHESDVLDYPCMSLSATGDNSLVGRHAAVPKTVVPGGHANFNLLVKTTEPYIARTNGARAYPWRLIAFEREDKNILSNQLVYLLASSSKLKDVSWIKPGKVAWDWWNDLNLSGVAFKTGFNTNTYKYYIDFAATNHLEYVNLDEGWSDQFDLLKVTDKLNMPELIRYAKQKKVGLILWCVWYTLDRQMIPALDQFAKWGISGVKVDFMDRDDQTVVNFQERLLQEAAKRKMFVDYHGAYHPTGMARTYPNLINTEGVKGLEWDKFDSLGTSPRHDVEIPFIRMFAGGMDYTPGAMRNYNQTNWKAIFDHPMSQGTRCHQLAMYTVYYAPLQMLADAPTDYEKEPVYLNYLAKIPTVWDETVALDGKVGEFVAVARRKGQQWFVGAMTNWDARTVKIKLDFLEAGKSYRAEIFQDGPNAARVGSDYQRIILKVKKGDSITINMAPGGGWSATFSPLINKNK